MEIKPNIIAVLAISNSPSAANCLSQLMACASVQWRIFLSPQMPIQNGSREQNHAPFRGDLLSLWQDLISSPYVENMRALASAIPEIWMGHPKFTRSSARDRATLLSVQIVLTHDGGIYRA